MDTCDECDRPFGGHGVFVPGDQQLVCTVCFAKKHPGKKPMPAGKVHPSLFANGGQYQVNIPASGSGIKGELRRKTNKRNSILGPR